MPHKTQYARSGDVNVAYQVIGNDLGGIAVHACARIAALAAPGEILVSNTVTHLVAAPASASAPSGRTT